MRKDSSISTISTIKDLKKNYSTHNWVFKSSYFKECSRCKMVVISYDDTCSRSCDEVIMDEALE